MKTKYIITCIIGVIASTLVCCGKPIITVQIDCDRNTDDIPDTVLVWADANAMHVRHLNSLDNCCRGYAPQVKIKNDTLLVYAVDNGTIVCLCECNYTIDYSISNLPYGRYVLMMADESGAYYEHSLSAMIHYEQNMDTVCIAEPPHKEPDISELDTTNTAFFVVESMPEFPDGVQALFAYIIEHKMQVDSLDNKRLVRIQFVVERDGSISNAEVVLSSGMIELDRDAVAVVESMPKWNPGKHRGQVVRVKYTVPVIYNPQ